MNTYRCNPDGEENQRATRESNRYIGGLKLQHEHVCHKSRTCCCSLTALEPDEECPIHGGGEFPLRCAVCGKFLPWPKPVEEEIPAAPDACRECGVQGQLKRGWTMALYCSERCERESVGRLHASMPGGPSPYIGWMPSHISNEIAARWKKDTSATSGCA